MREHRALGNAGRTAGVLQQRQAVETCLALHRRFLLAQAQGLHEAQRSLLLAFVDRLLQVIDAGQDDLPQRGVRLHRAHLRQQAVEHENRPGAGIVELIPGFGSGVLRIGVDDHQPGLERPEYGDWILQAIGQL